MRLSLVGRSPGQDKRNVGPPMGLTPSLNHQPQISGAAAEVVETSYQLGFSCISELRKRLRDPGDLSL